jgi:hypothetical protein
MAFLGTEGKMTRFGDAARVSDWLVVHKPGAPGTPASTALARNSDPAPAPAGAGEPGPANDNGNPATSSARADAGAASALVAPPAMVVRP